MHIVHLAEEKTHARKWTGNNLALWKSTILIGSFWLYSARICHEKIIISIALADAYIQILMRMQDIETTRLSDVIEPRVLGTRNMSLKHSSRVIWSLQFQNQTLRSLSKVNNRFKFTEFILNIEQISPCYNNRNNPNANNEKPRCEPFWYRCERIGFDDKKKRRRSEVYLFSYGILYGINVYQFRCCFDCKCFKINQKSYQGKIGGTNKAEHIDGIHSHQFDCMEIVYCSAVKSNRQDWN